MRLEADFFRSRLDVCAHSLGIATFDVTTEKLEYAPVIRRNTAIPTSRSQVFYALSPQQREVNISAYQGESHKLEENTFLGEFFFSGPSKGSKEVPEVLVRFDYDVHGILYVTAKDRASERSTDLVRNTALDGVEMLIHPIPPDRACPPGAQAADLRGTKPAIGSTPPQSFYRVRPGVLGSVP